jgi:16S rRNA (cytosine1402-N4)-methyltransferase
VSDTPSNINDEQRWERAFEHASVMTAEVVEALETVPSGTVLDATLGAGGHSEALLDARPDLDVLGLDRDPDAIRAARERLARFGERFVAERLAFGGLRSAMSEHEIEQLSAAIFDLGVSSPQLDRTERGFSYRQSGPLDMRMDPDQRWSASDVVNGYEEAELRRVIRRYGDERFAARIARAIVAARPIESTTELAGIITSAIPAATRRRGGHPAKRTFQAIRIEVNRELEELSGALDEAIDALKPGGRIAVLSYHSGEDRIVKDRFRVAAGQCECPTGLPCVCGAIETVRIVRGIRRTPGADEQQLNPRARSARLRVVERLDTAGQDDPARHSASVDRTRDSD